MALNQKKRDLAAVAAPGQAQTDHTESSGPADAGKRTVGAQIAKKSIACERERTRTVILSLFLDACQIIIWFAVKRICSTAYSLHRKAELVVVDRATSHGISMHSRQPLAAHGGGQIANTDKV
jgi:hypothetical protein